MTTDLEFSTNPYYPDPGIINYCENRGKIVSIVKTIILINFI